MVLTEFITLIEFLTKNFGAVAGIAILLTLFPCVVILLLMKLINKMQDSYDKKLDNIENDMTELSQAVKSLIEVIKWFVTKGSVINDNTK